MKIKTLCFLTLLTLTASIASAQTITRCGFSTSLYINWPTFHYDDCRSGNNPNEHILSPSTVGGLQVAWNFNASPAENTTPVLADGMLYFALYGGEQSAFFAVDARTGATIWRLNHGGGATVANGVLYLTWSGLSALNAKTGALLWGGGDLGGLPAVANGMVYGPSEAGAAAAVDASTGHTVWKTQLGDGVISSATVVNGVVYIGCRRLPGGYSCSQVFANEVFALNARTGAILWTAGVGNTSDSAPAVVNGVVYFGSDDGNIYALDALTGATLWSYATRGAVSSPAVANGIVYVGSGDANLYALDAITGVPRWTFRAGGGVASPAVANGVVYFGSADFNIYALDAGTGASLWKYTTVGQFGPVSDPVVANGALYIGAYVGPIAFHLPGH